MSYRCDIRIYRDSIKLIDYSKTLAKQIEDLSEGKLYLRNDKKLEHERETLRHEYNSGKFTIKEYTLKCHQLIEKILDNVDKNKVYSSTDTLPF